MGALRDPQWEKFACELAELKAPLEAYKLAGYLPHRGNASRLARRIEVRTRVKELLDEAAEFANIRRVRVLVEIDRVGRANLQDFVEAELAADGKPTGRVKLKDLTQLPRELTAAIASLEYDDAGQPKIKLHDRNQANFALLKHLGGLPEDDRRDVTNIFNLLSIDDQRALADALEAYAGGQRTISQEVAGERRPG